MFVLFVLGLFKPHAASTLKVRKLLVEHVMPRDDTHILKSRDYTTGMVAAALRAHSERGLVAKRYAYGGPGLGTHVEWLITPDGCDFVANACSEADQYWDDLMASEVDISACAPFPCRHDWAGLEIMDLGNAGEFSARAAEIAKMTQRQAARCNQESRGQ